jgi:hypothetical protein
MGGVYWCIVDGRTYGSWDCKEYALAGMQVEQRRAAERKAAQVHNQNCSEYVNLLLGRKQ